MASQEGTVVFQPYIFRCELLVSGREGIPHTTFASYHHEIHHPYHISPSALATRLAVEAWQIHQRQAQATQSLAGTMVHLKINPFTKENIWTKPPCLWVPCKFSKETPWVGLFAWKKDPITILRPMFCWRNVPSSCGWMEILNKQSSISCESMDLQPSFWCCPFLPFLPEALFSGNHSWFLEGGASSSHMMWAKGGMSLALSKC